MREVEPKSVAVEVESRERVHIRTRESVTTLAAWRVSLRSPTGAIVLAEAGGKSWYRGEGDLLGMPQERLAELWKAALSTDTEPELPQYG
jgi:hypothetical protein